MTKWQIQPKLLLCCNCLKVLGATENEETTRGFVVAFGEKLFLLWRKPRTSKPECFNLFGAHEKVAPVLTAVSARMNSWAKCGDERPDAPNVENEPRDRRRRIIGGHLGN